jgi:FdhD protein
MANAKATRAEAQSIYEERDALMFKGGVKTEGRLPIVREAPLTVFLNGRELASLVCSPHSFETLAIGYLVSEGVLRRRDDLKDMTCRQEEGAVWVDTVDVDAQPDGLWQRYFAGCRGGRPSSHSIDGLQQVPPITHAASFTAGNLLELMASLEREAQTYMLTGGVHEAALAHEGGFIVNCEDIGRRNALDRVLGYTFLNGIDACDKAIVLSARIASDMVAKAIRIGVPVMLSRAAPTCLAIDLAEQLGVTIVGFARGNRLNVYSHAERVVE